MPKRKSEYEFNLKLSDMEEDEEEKYYAERLGLKSQKDLDKLQRSYERDGIGEFLSLCETIKKIKPSEESDVKKKKRLKKETADLQKEEDELKKQMDKLKERLKEVKKSKKNMSITKKDDSENAGKLKKSIKYLPPHLRKTEATPEKVDLKTFLRRIINRISEGNLDVCVEQSLFEIKSFLQKDLNLYKERVSEVSQDINTIFFLEHILSTKEETTITFIACVAALLSCVCCRISRFLLAKTINFLSTQFKSLLETCEKNKIEATEEYQIAEVVYLKKIATILSCFFCFNIVTGDLILLFLKHLLHSAKNFVLRTELCLVFLKFSARKLKIDFPHMTENFFDEINFDNFEDFKTNPSAKLRFFYEDLLAMKTKRAKDHSASDRFQYVSNWLRTTPVMKNVDLEVFLINVPNNLLDSVDCEWCLELLEGEFRETKVTGRIITSDSVGSENSGAKLREDNILLDSNEDLMKISKSLRMNTEKKRAFFVAIGDSVDIQDSFQRLQRLITAKKDYETMFQVILTIFSHESEFNNFYVVLIKKFCEDEKVVPSLKKIMISYLSQLGNLDKHKKVTNLAELFFILCEAGYLHLDLFRFCKLDLEKDGSCSENVELFTFILLENILCQQKIEDSKKLVLRISKYSDIVEFYITSLLKVKPVLKEMSKKKDVDFRVVAENFEKLNLTLRKMV